MEDLLMKMSRLIIENYRNFEKIDLQISNLNVLFGVNDIGKTNLLSAIRMLLDPQCRRIGFVDSDYHLKDTTKKIRIVLGIDVSDEDDEDTKKIFAKAKVIRSGKDTLYISLETKYNAENLFSEIQMSWGDDLEDLESLQLTQQFRCEIDNIFNVIYIDSSIQLENVFKRYARTLFQNPKSLEESEKESLGECIENLNSMISGIKLIDKFQDDLSKEYGHYREEELEIKIKSEVEMDNIYSKLIPYISYENGKTYPTAGDGRKKIVEYSILGMESRESEKKKVNVFLIEELENHLHRSLQISLSFQLFEDRLFRHMFITTHSSLIVSRMDKVTLVKLYNPEKVCGKSVEYIVPKEYKKNKAKLNTELSEAIFAEKVLLVEGPSEKILFERVLGDISPKYECKDRYILQVDGVAFKTYYEILNKLGIRCLIKTDNDLKYFEKERKIEFSGINRCAEIAKIGKKNKRTLSLALSKEQFDNNRKKYQLKYFNEFEKTIVELKKRGIYLSIIDLENDLYEVISKTMDQYVKSAGGRTNPIDYLQKAKQNRMVELCERITKADSKAIFEDDKFLCIKELIQ